MTSDSPRCPLRVLHLITDLDVGGAEMMLARLLAASDRARVQQVVVSLTAGGPLASELDASGISVQTLDMQPNRPGVGALLRLLRILRRVRPHVLQTWLYHADFLGLVAAALVRQPALVWNVRCSQLDVTETPRALTLLIRTLGRASRRPAAVICNSIAGQRVHEGLGYRPRQWVVIPNGLDTGTFRPCAEARARFRREIGVDSAAPVAGLVARFHPMKDHHTFLQAVALAARARPDAHFVAVGRGVGTSAALAALADQLALRERLHLFEERRDIPQVLPGFDVAVSSSDSEGFPNTVIEAMACAVPCVVTDVGDSAAIVGGTGIVVPPRDPAALATGMLRVLALPGADREALGRAARSRVEREYALDRVAGRYQRLYEQLAGTADPAGSERACAG